MKTLVLITPNNHHKVGQVLLMLDCKPYRIDIERALSSLGYQYPIMIEDYIMIPKGYDRHVYFYKKHEKGFTAHKVEKGQESLISEKIFKDVSGYHNFITKYPKS